MSFTHTEIAEYSALIEKLFWAKRRPPLHLRSKVMEGQRIEGYEIELFLSRPRFLDSSRWIEHPIAKTRFVISRKVWRVFWPRADMKWHRYDPQPEVPGFEEFLNLVQEDPYHCFWG